MERQKNYLRHVIENKNILPIEQEFLKSIVDRIESDKNCKVTKVKKHLSECLYDSYILAINQKPYILNVNMSPELPNFWRELCSYNFTFHPNIFAHSLEGDEFKFICYEFPPDGVLASDISKSFLDPKLKIEKKFIKNFNEMHKVKIRDDDQTLEVCEAFTPSEHIFTLKTFPVAELFYDCRKLFKLTYKPNPDHCGICHFDLNLENVIYTQGEFKFINFEYAANANIYLDIFLAKENLNISENYFDNFLILSGIDKNTLFSYYDTANLFCFCYFNSKIVSEYLTFGTKNFLKLERYIKKSQSLYSKVSDKLLVSKNLDKSIKQFYNAWK